MKLESVIKKLRLIPKTVSQQWHDKNNNLDEVTAIQQGITKIAGLSKDKTYQKSVDWALSNLELCKASDLRTIISNEISTDDKTSANEDKDDLAFLNRHPEVAYAKISDVAELPVFSDLEQLVDDTANTYQKLSKNLSIKA